MNDADAGARGVLGPAEGDRAAVDHQRARVGRLRASEHLDQGRLTCAVLAHEREDLAGTDVERHVVDRDHTPKVLADAAERDGPRTRGRAFRAADGVSLPSDGGGQRPWGAAHVVHEVGSMEQDRHEDQAARDEVGRLLGDVQERQPGGDHAYQNRPQHRPGYAALPPGQLRAADHYRGDGPEPASGCAEPSRPSVSTAPTPAAAPVSTYVAARTFRTGTSEALAASGLPPTARTQRPNSVRFSSPHPAAITRAATTTDTGTGPIRPSPSHATVALCTATPLSPESRSAAPRAEANVARVAMNGLTPNPPIRMPLTTPTPAPASTTATSATGVDTPSRSSSAPITPVNATVEPGEMSSPRPRMTRVIATEMIAMTAVCWPMLRTFSTLRKSGREMLNPTKTTTIVAANTTSVGSSVASAAHPRAWARAGLHATMGPPTPRAPSAPD